MPSKFSRLARYFATPVGEGFARSNLYRFRLPRLRASLIFAFNRFSLRLRRRLISFRRSLAI
jgi:hypothetical protein